VRVVERERARESYADENVPCDLIVASAHARLFCRLASSQTCSGYMTHLRELSAEELDFVSGGWTVIEALTELARTGWPYSEGYPNPNLPPPRPKYPV
jgi:hypothetical protein